MERNLVCLQMEAVIPRAIGFAPVARMSNTYIAPGSDGVEKWFASVVRGIYVKSINAGSVQQYYRRVQL